MHAHANVYFVCAKFHGKKKTFVPWTQGKKQSSKRKYYKDQTCGAQILSLPMKIYMHTSTWG